MTAGEIATRNEIRQILNEAGINRTSVRELVNDVIEDIIKKNTEAVVKSYIETGLKDTIEDYVRKNCKQLIEHEVGSYLWSQFGNASISCNVKFDGLGVYHEDN